jgi:heterodisulfide reductase subunit C
MKCVEVCPKGVDPMGRIMSLRDKAMQAGYTGTYGARHAESFTQLIEHGGTLDELRLPIKTFGLFNIREMLKLLPVGIRSQLRGKMPPLFHKAIPGIENVRRLFRKTEGKR